MFFISITYHNQFINKFCLPYLHNTPEPNIFQHIHLNTLVPVTITSCPRFPLTCKLSVLLPWFLSPIHSKQSSYGDPFQKVILQTEKAKNHMFLLICVTGDRNSEAQAIVWRLPQGMVLRGHSSRCGSQIYGDRWCFDFGCWAHNAIYWSCITEIYMWNPNNLITNVTPKS